MSKKEPVSQKIKAPVSVSRSVTFCACVLLLYARCCVLESFLENERKQLLTNGCKKTVQEDGATRIGTPCNEALGMKRWE